MLQGHRKQGSRGFSFAIALGFFMLSVFSCTDNFDSIISNEVKISKIVEKDYLWNNDGTAATPRGGAASAVGNARISRVT